MEMEVFGVLVLPKIRQNTTGPVFGFDLRGNSSHDGEHLKNYRLIERAEIRE